MSEDDDEEKEGDNEPDTIGDAKVALVELGALFRIWIHIWRTLDGRRNMGLTSAWSSLHATARE